MNLCKKCDKYISLYLDELLEDKNKIDFLKHLEGCSQCASKLKEALYLADLCKEDQDIQLPENFSSSLHERLMEINTKDSKIKFGIFVYNKKFIASLSTAAILVVSLLAYNLLPHIASSKDSASGANETATAQDEMSSALNGYSGSNELKSNIYAGEDTDKSASANDTTVGTLSDNSSAIEDTDVTLKSNKQLSTNKTKNNVQAKKNQGKAETSPNSSEASKSKEAGATSRVFSEADQTDNNKYKYFSNYTQLNLKVSPQCIEIKALRKFMKEIGAIEIEPVTINSVVGNSTESTVTAQTENSATNSVQASLVSSGYIDYYLPLQLYSTLVNQAAKYKLELSTKTDIIKNDITDRYNILDTRKNELDKKLSEALINGEDTSTFEAERVKLTQEMNKIIAEKGMITIRTFFIL
ncbi:MAG: anti-sigma factor family protein [Ruminiclostridium sp.]